MVCVYLFVRLLLFFSFTSHVLGTVRTVTMLVCLSVCDCLSVQVLKPISQRKPIPFHFRSQEMRGLSV